MNPTFSQNDLRRFVKKSLEPMLEQATPDDTDFLADEDFLLRWSAGEVSETEQERFLEYLHRNPEALLDVSEMVSSGLLALPPLPKGLEASKPMPEQKRWNYRVLYYSSTVLALLALLAAVFFLGRIRKQEPEPQKVQMASGTIDGTIETPPETPEKPPGKISDPEEHPKPPNPFVHPPAPRPQYWGPPGGGGGYRHHGPGGGGHTFPPSHGPIARSPGGGGGFTPSFDIAASSEKRVCVIRQNVEGNEVVLALDEKLPEIVDWLIEEYKLEQVEDRFRGAFTVILSENDEKMEFKHSKGSMKFGITDLEWARNRLLQYFRRSEQGTRRNVM